MHRACRQLLALVFEYSIDDALPQPARLLGMAAAVIVHSSVLIDTLSP